MSDVDRRAQGRVEGGEPGIGQGTYTKSRTDPGKFALIPYITRVICVQDNKRLTAELTSLKLAHAGSTKEPIQVAQALILTGYIGGTNSLDSHRLPLFMLEQHARYRALGMYI